MNTLQSKITSLLLNSSLSNDQRQSVTSHIASLQPGEQIRIYAALENNRKLVNVYTEIIEKSKQQGSALSPEILEEALSEALSAI